jgi:hypothetical protein
MLKNRRFLSVLMNSQSNESEVSDFHDCQLAKTVSAIC